MREVTMSNGLSARERAHVELADLPGDVDRPALAKLSSDQVDVVADLLDGFETRSEVIRWMGDVTVRAIGSLDDEWFADLATDSGAMSALLGRPWGTLDPETFSASTAKETRRGIAAKDLIPAIQRSHSEFRWAASEYYDEVESVDQLPDPGKQKHPGMRPALSALDDRLEWALDRLLNGFADPEAFLVWGQTVISGTYAELDADVVEGAYFEMPVRRRMLGESPKARFFRESWAAEFLLPGFNRAAARAAARATEVVENESADKRVPPG
jgi:hypothetical protein